MKKNNISGNEYWRSLEELQGNEEFLRFAEREFPEHASELPAQFSRRGFVTLMGATLSMLGLTSCRKPVEKIIPYVSLPEEVLPGKPSYYATTMPLGTGACGLLVESHEGRPTKIEGNLQHPSSMGAAGSIMQAAVLGLYDPDRSGNVLHLGQRKEWKDIAAALGSLHDKYIASGGKGLAVLTEPFSGPTQARLIAGLKESMPEARIVSWAPIDDENILDGTSAAAGSALRPLYRFDRAEVILALDSDFLLTESDSLVSARGFADGRRLDTEQDRMNRLYVVESSYTVSGAAADHRLRLQSGQIWPFVLELATELNKRGLKVAGGSRSVPASSNLDREWIGILADDLIEHKGSSLVLAGRRQPPAVHALCFAINSALGNTNRTVQYVESSQYIADSRFKDFRALVGDMEAGSISALLIMGGNPVYDSPKDLRFGKALEKVGTSVHCSQYVDETSQLTTWHVPEAHFLESWSDAGAADGTMSVVQPLVAPLFGGRSQSEILHIVAAGNETSAYELVRDSWREIIGEERFEEQWRQTLHDGLHRGSALALREAKPDAGNIERMVRAQAVPEPATGVEDLEVVFETCPKLYDGRYANNGWLQELPHPITKLTWGNVATLSPATAEELKLESGDLVEISCGDDTLEIPVWILPGAADWSVSLSLGYGRESAGRVGDRVGANTYLLRNSTSMDITRGCSIKKTGRRAELASTQNHWSTEGRPFIREASLGEYRDEPDFASKAVEHPPLESMWKEHSYDKGLSVGDEY